MKIPTLQGNIKRRILVNYTAEPEIIQKILPKGFRPKLYKNKAIAGICLIRLEQIRPKRAPEIIGLSSENAAHRIAVLWEDESGKTREGVYIPRRDTNSMLNHFAGGRLFPGEHNKANFEVSKNETAIDFAMQSDDEKVSVKLKGEVSDEFPEDSIFSSLDDASKFFENGALGYSVKNSGDALDGIELKIKNWKVKPLNISSVESSFYDDESIFSKGSIEFDHALIMQNVAHEWHSAPRFDLR